MNTWNRRRAHFMRRWIHFSNIRNNRSSLMQLTSPYTRMEKTQFWQKKVWKTSKSNLLHLNQNLISKRNGTTKLCSQPSQKDSMISELESSIRSMKTRSTRVVVQSMPAAAWDKQTNQRVRLDNTLFKRGSLSHLIRSKKGIYVFYWTQLHIYNLIRKAKKQLKRQAQVKCKLKNNLWIRI